MSTFPRCADVLGEMANNRETFIKILLSDESVKDDDMVFTCEEITEPSRTRSRRSTTMKARQPRNITVVEKNNQTFFVCPCGFSSTNKSGSSRHKCRSTEAAVIFYCKDCGKFCQNAGSLKRHVQAMPFLY